MESCAIQIDPSLPRIVFKMKCKYDVFREYYIPYMEGEIIRCSRISDKMNPTIKAPAKVLSEMFKHFAHSTREATIWFYNDHVRFKTFIEDDDQDFFSLPSTSFSYVSRDFTFYNYTEDLTTTFNVRDIKAFLEFASFQNHLVSSYFESPSKPIEFLFNNSSDGYSSRLIMATIELPASQQPVPPPFNGSNRGSISNKSIEISQNTATNTSINESLVYTITNSDVDQQSKVSSNSACIRESVERSQSNISQNVNQFNSHQTDSQNNSNNLIDDDVRNMDVGNNELNQSNSVSEIRDEPDNSNNEKCIASTSHLVEKNSNTFESSGSEVYCNDGLNEDIENIVDIIDNMPDFSQGQNVHTSQSQSNVRDFLFGPDSQDGKISDIIVYDSDEE